MSVIGIVNPISGARANRQLAADRIDLLRAEAAQRGMDIDIHLTERSGHARELAAARAASGATLVIVWGGDGTLNEAGSALVGTSAVLGLVPSGSGNGLAAALDVPREPARALAAAFDGRTKTIDVGMIAGRPFFNIAGIGFDAHVARLFNEQPVGRRGGWPYVVIGVREGCRYRSKEYDVELDGNRRRLRALLIAFANGREYGMGARIAPGAELDDGLLNATVVEECSVPARFWHARRLALGTAHLASCVTVQTVSRSVIESDGSIEFHVDGEPGRADGRVEISVLPGALRVRVP